MDAKCDDIYVDSASTAVNSNSRNRTGGFGAGAGGGGDVSSSSSSGARTINSVAGQVTLKREVRKLLEVKKE
jgi:hypothetical protein